MIKQFIDKWLGRTSSTETKNSLNGNKSYSRGVTAAGSEAMSLEDIPRYPPFLEGLPCVSPEKLLSTQEELIKKIRSIMGLTKEEFVVFEAMLIRYASFVHLLPASQDHHHRGAGGLFRHGLEVINSAMHGAERVMFAATETPLARKELIPRWYMALFIACLCHDIGKPVSDVEVRALHDGNLVWNPFTHTLAEWFVAHNIERYVIRWHSNRHKKHESLTPLVVNKIASPSDLAYLASVGSEIVESMMACITGRADEHNKLKKLVQSGDEYSTEKDLKEQRAVGEIQSNQLGMQTERLIIDAMRSLVRSGKYSLNDSSNTMFLLDVNENDSGLSITSSSAELFIVWPKGGHLIAAHLEEKRYGGIPSDPNGIADILLERDILEYRYLNGGYSSRMWNIEAMGQEWWAVKLKNPLNLLDPLPPSIPGKIIAEGAKASSGTAQVTVDDAITNQRRKPSVPNVPLGQGASTVVTNQTQPSSKKTVSDKNDAVTVNHVVAKTTITFEDAKEWFEEKGVVGEVLLAFAQDVASGNKKWDVDLIRYQRPTRSFPEVAINWASLDGYGVERMVIQAELKSNEMVQLPNNGNLHDVPFPKGNVKSIILTSKPEECLIAVIEHNKTDISVAPQDSDAADADSIDVPSTLTPVSVSDGADDLFGDVFSDASSAKKIPSSAPISHSVTKPVKANSQEEMVELEIASADSSPQPIAVDTESLQVSDNNLASVADAPAFPYLTEYQQINDIRKFLVAMEQKGETADLETWDLDGKVLVTVKNFTKWMRKKTGLSESKVLIALKGQDMLKVSPDGKTNFIEVQ